MSSLFSHPWSIRLPWFMLFFDHHGGTHPTRQRRSPWLPAEMQKQNVLAAPQSAAQALDGVGSTLMPRVGALRATCGPSFRSFSPMREVGGCPDAVASRSGTPHPGIRRGWCHLHMDPPSATVTRVLKNAKSARTKRSVTCKKSQAPTPDTSAI